jgi:hypothetical protein
MRRCCAAAGASPACRSRSDRDPPRIRGTSHRIAAILPSRCNTPHPISVPRRIGARRRWIMEIVGIVMLGSVALWFSQQFDRHDW